MSPLQNTGLKILLIEDNPGDQVLISEYLREEFLNLDLDVAGTYQESENLLKRAQKPYKIILLDLSMPDLDRHNLIKKISALAPNSPIIILTGQSDIHIAIESLTMGCTDYLLKNDLNSQRLRKSITYAFERKHIDKQLQLSVQRYEQLFQLNPQPLWVINGESGAFLEINKSAIIKYGYSKSEFLNMKIQDIDQDYDDGRLKEHLSENEILKNGNLHTHQLQNGQTIEVKLYGNYIDYQGVDAILLMAIDLSETKSYISQIEKQNQQLKDIAWQQSHLVRAPLTRMMGIINRLEEKHLDLINGMDSEASFLLKNVLNTAHEIDEVVRSIVSKSDKQEK